MEDQESESHAVHSLELQKFMARRVAIVALPRTVYSSNFHTERKLNDILPRL